MLLPRNSVSDPGRECFDSETVLSACSESLESVSESSTGKAFLTNSQTSL
eukprot:CAMPEP_0117610930 /NCGR_PEP_ID=MMETSP0784-20121206/82128_1 /TAXON_ID=39447 /ORGANISM="" /LENGTH=49 /DNA_ID= /DNA_START= /DNA_END= /DNA_ORIENTATION=